MNATKLFTQFQKILRKIFYLNIKNYGNLKKHLDFSQRTKAEIQFHKSIFFVRLKPLICRQFLSRNSVRQTAQQNLSLDSHSLLTKICNQLWFLCDLPVWQPLAMTELCFRYTSSPEVFTKQCLIKKIMKCLVNKSMFGVLIDSKLISDWNEES